MSLYVQLLQTTTADGLRLDGCLHVPVERSNAVNACDALLCVHGAGSNFYSSTTLSGLIPSLLDIGLAVLRINTRGHDSIHTAATARGGRWQGSALEVVDQCRFDLQAWMDLLVERGYPRIGLLGHSLGAIKVLYTEAYQPHRATRALVALSPPRLSYARFQRGTEGNEFQATMAEAQRHIERGNPNALMEVRLPHPMIIAATTYVDKYGPEERYNILKFLPRLQRPVLFVYGRAELDEGGPAFDDLDQQVQSAAAPGQSISLVTIPGADHFYRDKHEPLSREITQWLDALAG